VKDIWTFYTKQAQFPEVLMQNKPNLLKGKMSASVYIKGYYKDFQLFRRRENKPNSKPNKANCRLWVGTSRKNHPHPDTRQSG